MQAIVIHSMQSAFISCLITAWTCCMHWFLPEQKKEERGFHGRQRGRGGSARWSYLFCFPLVSWHHGPTPLSTYVVLVNKRENCTRSGRQLGPSSSSSICVFEVWALQSFSMFSPDINFSPLNNNENIAAGINWVGCGPSSLGQISSPDINFFQAENG